MTTEAVMTIGNHSNNMNDEWDTPIQYIDAARRVMGRIDLDPASSVEANLRVGASRFYTLEESSLEPDVDWFGKVWMNPPYSRIIRQFTHKLAHQFQIGNVEEAIIVTNSGTETLWFKDLSRVASAICLHCGRIAFLQDGEPIRNNNKGQIFTYLGQNTQRFCEVFSEFGEIYVKPARV